MFPECPEHCNIKVTSANIPGILRAGWVRRTPLPWQFLLSPVKHVWEISNGLLVYAKAYIFFQKSFL